MNDRIQYLLSQYESNNCSREEMEELFYYLRHSRSNDGLLKRIVYHVYEGIRKNHPSFTYVDRDGKLVSTEPDQLQAVLGQPPGFDKKVLRKYTRIVVFSGILIFTIITGIGIKRLSNISPGEETAMSVLTKKFSERSEQKYLLLADSSQVWLNASSVLEFPDHFSGNVREVILKGEAYFRIKQVPGKPFIIYTAHSGKITAQTSGAASCNVKAYKDENEVVVAVSQGVVSVERSDKQMAELSSGREVKIGKIDRSVLEKNIEIGKIAAWQWGELIYDEAMLTDVIADLERVYNTKITISATEKERKKISVTFRREIGIEEALTRICGLTHTQLNISGNEFFIEPLSDSK
ncbi:MAG: FecR domain-containing protein [Chitinophagaceae bacterium]|nr:FecR domain-containing protein [Chitinophagaceae bacterium]